jgi:hypothetical protein
MNKMILAAMLTLTALSTQADQSVRGYIRQDGTYVQPHFQTAPNQNRYDNYSSQGNANPYTGAHGTQRNEFSTPPAYNKSNPAYVPDPYSTSSRHRNW